MENKLYGGIEAGGTKFVCAIAKSPIDILSQVTIDTTTPRETLQEVIAFFRSGSRVGSLGIASFGPLDLNEHSPTYGSITTTPKPGWQNVSLLDELKGTLNTNIAIDTDVNAAALGEHLYGAGMGVDNMIFLTVGTGIGGGFIARGEIFKGLSHPEIGHTLIPRLNGDDVQSSCRYHNNCLEGLASGTALKARAGQAAEYIQDENVWEVEAKYLAYGISNIILTVMPEKIIIGGGVMKHKGLIERVRDHLIDTLNGYINLPIVNEDIEQYIVSPSLGALSGVTGALVLAASSPHD